ERRERRVYRGGQLDESLPLEANPQHAWPPQRRKGADAARIDVQSRLIVERAVHCRVHTLQVRRFDRTEKLEGNVQAFGADPADIRWGRRQLTLQRADCRAHRFGKLERDEAANPFRLRHLNLSEDANYCELSFVSIALTIAHTNNAKGGGARRFSVQ